MAEEDGDAADGLRDGGVQALEAGDDALAALVAELELGQDGDEDEPYEEGERHRPGQRVAVVPACDGRVHEITGSQPGQRHDEARAQ